MTNLSAENEWIKAGWIKCPRSGIYYHPLHSYNGCGNCYECIESAKIEAAKRKKKNHQTLL